MILGMEFYTFQRIDEMRMIDDFDGVGTLDVIPVREGRERLADFDSHPELLHDLALESVHNILAVIDMSPWELVDAWHELLGPGSLGKENLPDPVEFVRDERAGRDDLLSL